MTRLFVWIFGGLLLGGLIHLVVILALPHLATRDLWSQVAALGTLENMTPIAAPAPGEPNPLGLDPALLYGVCQIDLDAGPGVVNGTLPLSFWSLAVFDRQGQIVYSTTSRSGSGVGRTLDMGIFNPAQMRLLAEQRFEIEEGLLIVEAPSDDVMVVIRLAPAHDAMRARYRDMLDQLRCLTIR
ncbi:DUF1254 domain-containing protein [Pelagibacterium xiamenense]|uniref:DUF1254 domain-containing protein n=1 Tax=Pelagibacterium xiamenense TaxID=2901140 RepID=UPI001E2C20E1|nr:DUF1254 domain-containing protein [Pelagibacterium xiamenense]MCD7059435.1 DUF1254 domain-containing protein [Pelagibacterium xiamenense]